MIALDRAADQRILKGAPATLTAVLPDADGEADQTVDSGVTVTVTRIDGTALATAQAATTTLNGVATYTLTASQTGAGLDWLTATWTTGGTVRATTVHEIVGRHWFAPSRLRDVAGVSKALGSGVGDMTGQALIDARTWIESLIEHATGAAWVPRVQLDELDASGRDEVLLSRIWPRTLRSLTIDGTAQTVADFTLTDYGSVRRDSSGPILSANARGFVALYDHGADAPPSVLVEAAIEAAADRIKNRISTLGNRLTGISGEYGTISYSRIDRDNPTGIPAVDAVIRAHDRRSPGVG